MAPLTPMCMAAIHRIQGLDREAAHIWLTRPDTLDARQLEALASLLTQEEHARRQRFVFQRDRDRFLVTRGLVRTTLSHYVPDVPPTAWAFETNAYGRPEISSPRCEPRLRFNLSHTDGLIACAVALDRELGVDVELASRRISVRELAPTVFAAPELAALLRLPEDQQRERFFTLWTLKEAYIKARGMGLSLPLDRFWYCLDGETGPRLTVDSSLLDTAQTWQLLHHQPSPQHHLAMAVRRAPGRDLSIAWRAGIPLGDWSPFKPYTGGQAR